MGDEVARLGVAHAEDALGAVEVDDALGARPVEAADDAKDPMAERRGLLTRERREGTSKERGH